MVCFDEGMQLDERAQRTFFACWIEQSSTWLGLVVPFHVVLKEKILKVTNFKGRRKNGWKSFERLKQNVANEVVWSHWFVWVSLITFSVRQRSNTFLKKLEYLESNTALHWLNNVGFCWKLKKIIIPLNEIGWRYWLFFQYYPLIFTFCRCLDFFVLVSRENIDAVCRLFFVMVCV